MEFKIGDIVTHKTGKEMFVIIKLKPIKWFRKYEKCVTSKLDCINTEVEHRTFHLSELRKVKN